jgi:hypothetical protein
MTVASAPHLRRVRFGVTAAALVAIALATLVPEPGTHHGSHLCLVCGSFGGVDTVLNVLLFAPLGVGLALYCGQGKRALLAMFALSVLIESLQLLIPGRDATIGDVVTNTFGGGIGFAACRYALVWLRPSPRAAARLVAVWCAAWLIVQAVSNFAFLPSIPDGKYYGQLARYLGDRPVFRGRVLSATADDLVIPNTAFADSRAVQGSLREGATIAATVLPAGPTPGVAAIVRVADAEQREILLLGQDGKSMVFGIRTGASLLRLRPPYFAVADAFPAGTMTGRILNTSPVRVSGRYTSGHVRLTVQSGTGIHDRQFQASASLGWTTILPFQWLIQGTRREVALSWIWVALLLVPLGYWGAHSAELLHRPRMLRMTALGLAGFLLLCTGLVVLPRFMGLEGASLSEWLSAAIGCLLGAGLARESWRPLPHPTCSKARA